MEVGKLNSYTFKSTQNLPQKTEKKEANSIEKKKLKDILPNNDKYEDPLMKWPLRGLAYTNEVGVAIMEIAPALGQALWVPALMYFGADIYDKYKNEQNEYNPCGRRGLKQALFQGLASVTLPTAAVVVGQKAFSLLGYLEKNRLSLASREKISDYAVDFISSGHLAKYKGRDAECKQSFESGLENILKYKRTEKKLQNGGNRFVEFLRHPIEALTIHPSASSAKSYADTTINSLIELKKELYGDTPKTKQNLKWHNIVDKNIFKGVTKDEAIRDAIVRYQKSQIMKSKWIKTTGGFIALALAAKPIDVLVERFILPHVVKPGLDKLGIDSAESVLNKKTTAPDTQNIT